MVYREVIALCPQIHKRQPMYVQRNTEARSRIIATVEKR